MKYEVSFKCGDNAGLGSAETQEELLRILAAFISVAELNENEMTITVNRREGEGDK